MLLALSIICVVRVNGYSPEVTLTQGSLRGVEQKTWSGRTFSSFTGIPYAEPPVGELRFQAPVPAKPWKELLDASRPAPWCPQISSISLLAAGTDDCLYLNVFTAQLPSADKQPLPVLFFIHGGGFATWTSEFFGPHILLDKNVVLVTVNYRLGILGFLSTGDLVLPGNNGLKDQSLALKWVKENIARFGGDPSKVTIFGQSAGGASVHYHMLSPLSKGLFHGAISQSGTALSGWALGTEQTVHNSKKLGRYLNCTTSTTTEMVECLRKIDALTLVEQEEKFYEWHYDPVNDFTPVIEPKHDGAFLTEHPVEIIKSGKHSDVPYLIGMTSEEGAVKAASIYRHYETVRQLNENFNTIAPLSLLYRETSSNRGEVTEKIRQFYFENRTIDNSTKDDVTKMYTDFLYLIPSESAARMHFKYSKQPVFFYLFNYKGSTSITKRMGDRQYDYGVSHCDDLLYLLSMDFFFPAYQPTRDDEEMMEMMTSMWVNFATTGNPTEADYRIPIKWKPMQSDKLEYYLIRNSSDMTMAEHLFKERSEFWRSLPLGGMKQQVVDALQ